MKVFSCNWLLWLGIVGCCAAQNAYLYHLDVHPRPVPFPKVSIDSATANAILARRLNATDSLSLGHLHDDTVLEYLSWYGGQPQLLLGLGGTSQEFARFVVVIEGYDGDSLPNPQGVTVERADPSLAATSHYETLISQEDTSTAPPCKGYITLESGIHVTYLLDPVDRCPIHTALTYELDRDTDGSAKFEPEIILNALKLNQGSGSRGLVKLDMTRMKTSPAARDTAITAAFKTSYHALEKLASAGKVESTILLLPSQRAPTLLNLTPREIRSDRDEEPLPQPFVSTIKSKTDTTPSSTNSSATTLPPLGSFLPSCFPSNETCIERTNTCSGHGFCYAKSSQCFVCSCGSTVVRQDSDGGNVKTVQWGGTACERKDVSVPFFLFAGFAVTMTAVVAGAVGMLYSMGSEKLPSVIGSGVAGPRAQR